MLTPPHNLDGSLVNIQTHMTNIHLYLQYPVEDKVSLSKLIIRSTNKVTMFNYFDGCTLACVLSHIVVRHTNVVFVATLTGLQTFSTRLHTLKVANNCVD